LLALAGKMTAADKPGAAARLKVEVSRPLSREVFDYEDFTGRTEAVESVEIRARVTGMLTKVLFQAGSLVKQGDLLFEIDPRPYQAELDKVEAEVRRAEARLKHQAEEVERAKKLLENKTLSREEFSRALAGREDAEGALRVARAGRDLAKLNLMFTRITAPITGRIGRPSLSPGNLVKADDTALTTIVSMNPMYVYFDIYERTLLRLRRTAREGKAKGEGTPVQLGLTDEEGFPRQGKIDFVDNRLNPATGTLHLRAVFPNADGFLLPGLFARVRLATGEPYKALLIPERAVTTGQEHSPSGGPPAGQGTPYVFVVTDRNVVERRPVKLGAVFDGLRVVKEGLAVGDWVISSGPKGVRPGQTVAPQRTGLPNQPPAPGEAPGPEKPAPGSEQP
jgi:RND family efflux transporter MFP subunit